MRGQGQRSFVAENLFATSAKRHNERVMNSKWKLCWRCQKDKDPRGGFLRITAGLHKFICKDCMDAKEKERSMKREE